MFKRAGFTSFNQFVMIGPKYVWMKLNGRINRAFKRLIGRLFGLGISDSNFRKALLPTIADHDAFMRSFKQQGSRRFFIQPQMKDSIILSLLAVQSQEDFLLRAADMVCEHVFDLLGSDPTPLGWQIDWHTDFKSGFRWNLNMYYTEIHPAQFPGGYDLKIPWELSRCQHFTWLGQAYWLTNDEKYAKEFLIEIKDWIQHNPNEHGVNWACSMDIAIRAVNWLWGYAFFQDSPTIDDDFRMNFCKSLLAHGRHIMTNLERTATLTGNHYLADIVGLVYLGILLPEFREASHWRDFGLKELEREMFKQVYPDGGNYESSTNYHRLATELFLSATLLARLNGHSFGQEYMNRLERMLDLIYQITKPDGTVPIIGDQDNGRLHRLKIWENPDHEWKDFRPLLAIGSVLFENTKWGKAAGDHWEEAIWMYGNKALEAYHRSVRDPNLQLGSIGFENAGLYILRSNDIYVAVDLGPIGQNGRGGHAHNDSLSFELFSSGQTWIQDPGSYTYTQDYKARNMFRSTAFHNTLTMPGYEQNGLSEVALFSMKEESITRMLSWKCEPNSHTTLVGEVQYLLRHKFIHRRSFRLHTEYQALLLVDQVEGIMPSTGQLMFHFAPNLVVELIREPYPGLKLTNPDGLVAWLFSISPRKTVIDLQDGWISESYGRRVLGTVASIGFRPGQEHITGIFLPGDVDPSFRIEKIINNENRNR